MRCAQCETEWSGSIAGGIGPICGKCGSDDFMSARLWNKFATLRARVEKLEAVLRTALEWDGADSEGVDAVWADEAKALLAESGPVFGIKPANSNDSPLAECEEVERG